MRYYLDTEFNGHGGELISLALVTEGRVPLYIVNTGLSSRVDDWIMDNVIHNLRVAPVQPVDVERVNDFGGLIRAYLGDDDHPTIIADSPVDIGRFCTAISTDWNGGWRSTDYPLMTFEVHNVDCYPTTLPDAVQHNAVWDALALKHRLEAI